jgi:hypothetical protein
MEVVDKPARSEDHLAATVAVLGDVGHIAELHLAARKALTVDALKTPRLRYLRRSVEAWSERWNLTDPWCIQWALHTLAWWRYRKDDDPFKGCPSWYWWEEENPLGYLPPFVDSYPGFEVRVAAFDPRLQTTKQYEQDVSGSFEAKVTRYRDQLRANLEGYLQFAKKEMAAKSVPHPPELRAQKQFYWIAGYQTRGWSEERIAQAENKDRRTIGKQIAKLAKVIGLNPREALRYDSEQTVEIIRQTLHSAMAPKQMGARNSPPTAPGH